MIFSHGRESVLQPKSSTNKPGPNATESVEEFFVDGMYTEMYFTGMSKSYSIAEARANLPAIVDQAELGNPIELTRRGKPVAVVLSRHQFELLTSRRADFLQAYRAFLEKFPLEEVGLDAEFLDSLRDRGSGRGVEL